MLTPLVVSQSSHPRSRTVDPLSHSGQASRPLVPNSVAQFSCGVIDIVESMSRRVFLTAVCAPPRESFFLNFYDVTLPDFRIDSCVDVYVLYDYSDISAPPL